MKRRIVQFTSIEVLCLAEASGKTALKAWHTCGGQRRKKPSVFSRPSSMTKYIAASDNLSPYILLSAVLKYSPYVYSYVYQTNSII